MGRFSLQRDSNDSNAEMHSRNRSLSSTKAKLANMMRWSSSTTLVEGSRPRKSEHSIHRRQLESPGSSSGNETVASTEPSEAANRLRNLTTNEIFRIDKSTLPSSLGLDHEGTEDILNHSRSKLYSSRDGRFLIPQNQIHDIASKLKTSASATPVDLHAFANEQDIAFESLSRLIEAHANRDWPRVMIDVDGRSFLCSHQFAENVKATVNEVVNATGNGTRDLTAAVGHGVPPPIVMALATEAASGKQGHVRFAGEHVVYIPSCSCCEEVKRQESTRQEEREANDRFVQLIESEIWCALHLYAAGVIETQDATLRQDLEEAATNHFRLIIIPQTTSTAAQQNLLNNEVRRGATEQLNRASQTVRTFSQLQTTVAQLGAYLNIPPPSEELVLDTKNRMLTESAQSVQTMSRGLDILQNLIWILLATSGPGLFMSSVKYTSKMINQYDAVGDDSEVAGMLNLWWDKVRDGAFDPEDLRQMKELAKDAVDAWREERWG